MMDKEIAIALLSTTILSQMTVKIYLKYRPALSHPKILNAYNQSDAVNFDALQYLL